MVCVFFKRIVSAVPIRRQSFSDRRRDAANRAPPVYEAGSASILYKPITLALLRAALQNIEVESSAVIADANNEPAVGAPSRAPRPALTLVPVNGLDEDALEDLKYVSKRPEFVAEMLTSAESDIAQSCQLLLDTLAGRSPISLRDTAHTLKGVCITIGAQRLVGVADNLMRASRDELEQSSDRLTADLREAHQTTVMAIRKAVAEFSPASASNSSAL